MRTFVNHKTGEIRFLQRFNGYFVVAKYIPSEEEGVVTLKFWSAQDPEPTIAHWSTKETEYGSWYTHELFQVCKYIEKFPIGSVVKSKFWKELSYMEQDRDDANRCAARLYREWNLIEQD